MRALALAVSFLIPSVAAFAEQAPLRFSISDSSTMPMISFDNGQPNGGILHELHRSIAEKLGRKAEQQVVSRTRVQSLLVNGEVDVNCYTNPAWLAIELPNYRWSVPFMAQQTVLVARAETTATDLAHLHGERIGTVLGFYYPDVDALFLNGTLTRDDARTEYQGLMKLEAGRIRYAVSTQVAVDWFNRNRPENTRLKTVDQINEFSVHCVVRDEPDVPAAEILNAMQELKKAGTFDAILSRYR
ncbi:amino acid ABC transporter substrate-binding protein [Stutzerimonas stutzeri]|uniref:Amino acid ABC transporter substrate-binding protein n=1 Tax=Stutzerimonas stutzeri TaxID=316 RepID=W8RDB0_STUST|nr:transporter substrate-binding domain-containing protein [Stutzerimonas stutzeri]AHL76452.1 amino acid ABC transporter substrate-binding protein [Stutzerimonas stutzeri]MCQ4329685.1 transporter substrate-binding domain-containing protein [Stutzerimonas stutzeri]